MTDKNILAAWDGIFTDKQWDAIRQMSIYADKKGIRLHEAVVDQLAANSKSVEDLRGYVDGYAERSLRDVVAERKKTSGPQSSHAQLTKPCPACGKMMRLLPIKDHDKYKSKWGCGSGCGSCNHGGGCGYVEFNELSIEEIIKQEGLK